MSYTALSPVVTAGLLDALNAGLPREAHAACADAVGAYGIALSSTDFLMGIAMGVSACGVVAIALGATMSHRARVEREEREFALNLGNTAAQPVLSQEVKDNQPKTKAAAEIIKPQRAKPVSAAVEPAVTTEPLQAEAPAKPVELKDPVKSMSSSPQHLAKPKTVTLTDDAHIKQPSTKSEEPSVSSEGRHYASDYGEIAENYVSRLSWRDRMSIRARGVRQMLIERFGIDMFEDVPVIQRADGSVGDVGTSWWDAALGDAVRHDFSDIATIDDIDMTGVRNVLIAQGNRRAAFKQLPDLPAPQMSAPQVQPHKVDAYVSRVAHLNLSAEDRSVFITHHVPFVDEEAFPELNALDENEDLWALAMSALERRGADPTALEAQTFSADATSYEHELPTEVLPFRPVAGHPEVVDKASYVDYLLRQEFEKNTSAAVRTTSRNYLKLLDGGSTSSAPTIFTIRAREMAKPKHAPKHMAAHTGFDNLPIAAQA